VLACALDMAPSKDPRSSVVTAHEAGKSKKTRRQIRREARRKIRVAEQARSEALRGAPPVLPAVSIPRAATPTLDGPTPPAKWAGRDPDREVLPRPTPRVPHMAPVALPFPAKFDGGLTNPVAEIILAALRSGCSHRMAAGCAMISEITLSQWMHREGEPYVTFQHLVRQAETLPKLFLLDSVLAGARMDSYLALEVLGRKEQDSFGKPVQVNQFNQTFNLGDLLERNGAPKPVGAQSTAAPADPRRRALEGAAP